MKVRVDHMKIWVIKFTIILAILLVVLPGIVQAKIVSVSASTHVLALNDDGTVWAWGDNRYGQLGIGTIGGTQASPQKVLIDNITQISTGGFDSFALKKDGTVWAWGCGDDGWLGYGGNESQSTPVQVKNLTDIVAISAEIQNCYALKNDGTVWAWGDNRDGKLGIGTKDKKFTPVQVKGLTGIKTLGKGDRGTYAIKDDGTVYAWGENTYEGDDSVYGALGDSSGPGERLTPFQVQGVSNVVQIAGGPDNTVYVKNDGTVWAWGNNHYGAIGDGTIKNWPSDVTLTSIQLTIKDIKDVSTMNSHSIVLKNDGTVWVWGKYIDRKGEFDNSGLPATNQLGEPTPAQVKNIDHVVDVSAGFLCDIALKDDGSVWGWGRNDEKELGNTKNDVEPYPILIFKGPEQSTPIPIVTSTQDPVQSSPSVNMSQTTVIPTQKQAGSTPVPTPGLMFGNMATIGCMLLVTVLLIGFVRQKK